MASHHAQHPPAEHPENHEAKDVNVRGLVITSIALLIASVIVYAIVYGVMFGIEDNLAKSDQTAATAVVQAPLMPPEPRLQGVQGFHNNTPRADNNEWVKKNKELLSSYGKTDSPGFVRIPVNRAMELVLERKMLPLQPAHAPNTQPSSTTVPTSQPTAQRITPATTQGGRNAQ